jgi:hypothetical protein
MNENELLTRDCNATKNGFKDGDYLLRSYVRGSRTRWEDRSFGGSEVTLYGYSGVTKS